MGRRKLRVLVVEDSPVNCRALVQMINGDPDLEVVATARDGEEGLKSALTERPDVITLDLHLPRVDGYTFLRLLMAKRPTPVVVISSYAHRDEAFRALELGAIDFVARTQRHLEADDLLAKLKSVKLLEPAALRSRRPPSDPSRKPVRLAVIGASTGGPPAIAEILARLPADLPMAVLIAQHMPQRFTQAFAERLNRSSRFEVDEAKDGELIVAGRALVAPGGRNLQIRRSGDLLLTKVTEPTSDAKYHPSIDALFESAAALAQKGLPTIGAIMTGMGSDGRQGTMLLKAAGGATLAESQESAVIFGMPREAIATGKVDRVLSTSGIAEALVRFGQDGR